MRWIAAKLLDGMTRLTWKRLTGVGVVGLLVASVGWQTSKFGAFTTPATQPNAGGKDDDPQPKRSGESEPEPGSVPRFTSDIDAQSHAVATDLLDAALGRLRRAPGFGTGIPEFVVNSVREQTLRPLADMVLRNKGSATALRQVLRQHACQHAPEEELLAVAQLQLDITAAADPDAIDCLLKREAEDVVTWAALDAWRHAGLPETPALEVLKRNATDERTRERLDVRSDEERKRQRAALHAHSRVLVLQDIAVDSSAGAVLPNMIEAETSKE